MSDDVYHCPGMLLCSPHVEMKLREIRGKAHAPKQPQAAE
jgi:hypothetical protein